MHLTKIGNVAIPQHIIRQAATQTSSCDNGQLFVDTGMLGSWSVVMASPNCEWHTDSHSHYNWSLLLVVRNDNNSVVKSFGEKVITQQEVGTILLLDLRHKHRLKSTEKTTQLSWMAIAWDSKKRPSRNECLADVSEFLKLEQPRLIQCDPDYRKTPKTNRYCWHCQKDLENGQEKAVYVDLGTMSIVHPDDRHLVNSVMCLIGKTCIRNQKIPDEFTIRIHGGHANDR